MKNREIKFRAWNIPNKLMYMDIQNGVLCQNEKGQLVLGTSFGTICKDIGSVVMQYTGLKDKNGKEIYEGDIINLRNTYNYTVEYENGCFILRHTKIKDTEGCFVRWGNLSRTQDADLVDKLKVEIIGNIYENPELL